MKLWKKLVTLTLCICLVGSLAACGGDKKDAANTITIYDGQFSEMQLIHYMVKLLVEDQTDLKVDIKDQMTPVNSFHEVTGGGADLMNSYDGTLLSTFLQSDPSEVPEGETIYDYANKKASEEYGVHLLGKLGMENTYCIAVPQAIADKYNLKTVSDLIPVADQLVFGAEHEFFDAEGSMRYGPFVDYYGLKFKDYKPVDLNLKYSAIESGSFDVTQVYTTDGMNKKVGLVILEDDKEFFPEYNAALLVRDDLFERFKDTAPNLESVLGQLEGKFTDEIMTDLSYDVDVNGRTVPEVAEEFLRDQGLLK